MHQQAEDVIAQAGGRGRAKRKREMMESAAAAAAGSRVPRVDAYFLQVDLAAAVALNDVRAVGRGIC
jgi:hypothetical protein